MCNPLLICAICVIADSSLLSLCASAAISSAYNAPMAGGHEFSKYQRGVIQRYYEHADTIALQRLSEIVSDLYLAEGGKATTLWNTARTALAKLAPPDDPHVLKVLSVRSVTGLAKLVTELSAGAKATASGSPSAAAPVPTTGPIVGAGTSPASSGGDGTTASAAASAVAPATAAPVPTPAQSPAPTRANPLAPPTADQLKHAMRAFRKRLKLTRLDEESKLGRVGNPMSGGKRSGVIAIMPPRGPEYPQAVWDELVKQGRLKRAGASFYELADGT